MERRDITATITGSGSLEAANTYSVTSLVEGSILTAGFEEGDQVEEFDVEILRIYRCSGQDSRSMMIRVTDEDLLAKTGGIVQGMSGSPILQDGKLVGAVTHVLVNDPTCGYAIFADTMLEAGA